MMSKYSTFEENKVNSSIFPKCWWICLLPKFKGIMEEVIIPSYPQQNSDCPSITQTKA